jgi:hypothetical protein
VDAGAEGGGFGRVGWVGVGRGGVVDPEDGDEGVDSDGEIHGGDVAGVCESRALAGGHALAGLGEGEPGDEGIDREVVLAGNGEERVLW